MTTADDLLETIRANLGTAVKMDLWLRDLLIAYIDAPKTADKPPSESINSEEVDRSEPVTESYKQKVIEALRENGDPISIDAAELLELLHPPEPNNGDISLPTKTAPREPMTYSDYKYEADKWIGKAGSVAFAKGVHWAEKHHGIGGED